MKGIPSSRRYNVDHVTRLLNKAHGSPSAPNFSQRNYKSMLALQAETQRRNAEKSQPKQNTFKLSRFGSVGSMLFPKKEENKLAKQAGDEEKKRAVSLVAAEKPKLIEERRAEAPAALAKAELIVNQTELPQKSVSENPNSPAKGGTLAAETNRRLREAEEAKSPPGMRLLSSEEQQASLDKLLSEKRDTITALNKVPLASTTPSIVSLRRELERKLVDLEKSIDVFSRKRVFVKT